jgi:hypothetical protein
VWQNNQGNAGVLDEHLVNMVFEHYDEMNDIRDSAQKEAVAGYHMFQENLHRYFGLKKPITING